jgi:hypothetical protein
MLAVEKPPPRLALDSACVVLGRINGVGWVAL